MTAGPPPLTIDALPADRPVAREAACSAMPDSAGVGWGTVGAVAVALGVGWLPALVADEVIARVSALHALAAGPHPYVQTTHVGLFYGITPVVAISSFVLFLSPGGVLVLALAQARGAVEWVVLAFGGSLFFSIVLGTLAKLAFGTPLTAAIMLSLWVGTAVLGWLVLAYRVHTGATVPWPVASWPDIRRLLWMLGAAFLGICALLPKIFWENFNVDGIEAFEFGRSLSTHLLPHWEIHNGVFGFYHNFMLFAYPNHWFITAFGTVEAAVRLPFLLYVIVLFAVLVLLIEHRSARQLLGVEEAMLWLALAVYTVVQAYDATYEPFFADLAETAGSDSLQAACFLSACYALWTARRGWFWMFALMTYAAAPGGLLLLGGLSVATCLSAAPERRQQVALLARVIAVGVLIGVLHELLYNRLALGGVNDQFSAKNMLRRLYPPTLTEVVRLNALLFPCGILPALSLLAVRRKQDVVSWVLAVVTLGYFGVIYVQAWTSLHQFTPIMILPVVVFWRLYLGAPPRTQRWLLPSVAAAAALALALSLPRSFQINQATRAFGQSIEYKIGDYGAAYEPAVRASTHLYALFPSDYRLHYPEQPWGTDPLSLVYYATREKPDGTLTNYVIQESGAAAPAGATRVTAQDGVSVYVRDVERWQRERNPPLPRVVVSPLYEPILRRTSQFFRAYTERMQQRAGEQGEIQ